MNICGRTSCLPHYLNRSLLDPPRFIDSNSTIYYKYFTNLVKNKDIVMIIKTKHLWVHTDNSFTHKYLAR